MAFLYSSYIILYVSSSFSFLVEAEASFELNSLARCLRSRQAILGSVLGSYIDKIYKQDGNIYTALVNVAGVQVSLLRRSSLRLFLGRVSNLTDSNSSLLTLLVHSPQRYHPRCYFRSEGTSHPNPSLLPCSLSPSNRELIVFVLLDSTGSLRLQP